MQGGRAPDRQTAAFHPDGLGRKLLPEFCQESGLPDAGLTAHEDDVSAASTGPLVTVPEDPDLSLSTDEDGQASLRLDIETRARLECREDLPGGDRGVLAL